MIKRDDIMWLAGLLEGEGCFSLAQGKYPLIVLKMTDGDVVARVSDMWDTRICRDRNLHRTQINGACAAGWMMTLYPLLYKRRKKVIADIIKFWKEYVCQRAPKGSRFMAKCHPDRVSVGSDTCNPCYQREYRERKLLRRAV